MKTTIIFLAAAVLTCSFCGISSARGHEEKISFNDLPMAVAGAFKAAYPNAVGKKVEKEHRHHKTLYEIEGKNGSNCLKACYMEDGTLFESKEKIAPASLPEAVKKAIEAAYPGKKIIEAEKKFEDNVTEYEVEFRTLLFFEKEISLDETGKILED
jgi:hypothetical protein